MSENEKYGKKYYDAMNTLNLDQIRVLDGMSDGDVEAWLSHGAPKRALDVQLEQQNVRDRKGQTPPSSAAGGVKLKGVTPELGDGKIGEFGLELRPNRQPNAIDTEFADAALAKFASVYQQFVGSPANAQKIVTFIGSRGGKITFNNLAIAFEQLFGQLELRIVDKAVETQETKFRKDGKPAPVNPYFFARPEKTILVETILSPADVRRLSANDTDRLMKPVRFPDAGVLSASEYAKTPEFRNENPAPQIETQEIAVTLHEWKSFLLRNPGYARVCAIPGVEDLVVKYVDEIAHEKPSEVVFKDAINWLDHEGIIKLSDADKGYIKSGATTIHVGAGAKQHYTKNKPLAAAVKNMTAEEYKNAMLTDPEFRAMVDESV